MTLLHSTPSRGSPMLNILAYVIVGTRFLVQLALCIAVVMTATFPLLFLLACITPKYFLYIEALVVAFIIWYHRDYKE